MKTVVAYFAIYIVWGTTYLAITFALETLPVFFIGTARFLTGGAILMCLALSRGTQRPTLDNWLAATKSGFLSFFVSYGTLTWAQQVLPSSIASLLVSLEPAWFVVLDWLLFKGPRPVGKVVVGQIIGFIGCALLIFSEPPAESAASVSNLRYTLSAASMIICTFTWVYGSLLSRSPAAHPDSTTAAAMQMLSGGTAFLVASLIAGDFGRLSGASAKSLLAVGYLILFGSVFAYSAFVFLLRTQPSAKVAAHTFVNPIVAVAIGWALGGERITPLILAAAVFVIVSVILTVYSDRGKSASR